jgi:hypothetical protein
MSSRNVAFAPGVGNTPNTTVRIREAIGIICVVVAATLGLLGLAFTFGAGGHEADAVRANGVVQLGFAVVLGAVGLLLLRSGKRARSTSRGRRAP